MNIDRAKARKLAVILKKPYVNYKDLRIALGVNTNAIPRIREVISKDESLICPYDKTKVDLDNVLKFYNVDKKELLKKVNEILKECKKDDSKIRNWKCG